MLRAINEVLDERIVETAVEKALERLRGGQERHLDRRTAIERELSLIEGRERHLAEAIARGDAVDPLVAALKAEEERKAALTKDLAGLVDLDKVSSLDARRLKQTLRARVADAKGLLGRHVPQARQMLRKLLVDRLEFTPFEDRGQRGYRFAGQGTFGRILAGDVLPPALVSPAGFEPAFRP